MRLPRTAALAYPLLMLPTVTVVSQVEPRLVETRAFTVPPLSATHATTTVEPFAATEGRPLRPSDVEIVVVPIAVFVQFAPRSFDRATLISPVVASVYATYTSSPVAAIVG